MSPQMTDTPEKKGKKITMTDMKKDNDEAQKSKEGILKHISN